MNKSMENLIRLIAIILLIVLVHGIAIIAMAAILAIPINHFVEYENRGLANYVALMSATIIVISKLKTKVKIK